MPNENDSFKFLDELRKLDYLKPLVQLIKLDGVGSDIITMSGGDEDELPPI